MAKVCAQRLVIPDLTVSGVPPSGVDRLKVEMLDTIRDILILTANNQAEADR